MENKKVFGISVYIESFDPEYILKFSKDTEIFVSIHMPEDLERPDYKERVEEIFKFLNENGYKIIADISPVVLKALDIQTPQQIIDKFNIDYIRLDYGYEKQIMELSKVANIVVNASTIKELEEIPENCIFMHNFYPRMDTALDRKNFESLNQTLKQHKGKIYTFIPGDKTLRSPIFEQLPTLEEHRGKDVFYSFLDMYKNNDIDGIFISDCELEDETIKRINVYLSKKIITIKADMPDKYIGNIYQLRSDSGANVERISSTRSSLHRESMDIEPNNTIERPKGSITVDNKLYKRYMGEINFVKNNLGADKRVNVLTKVEEGLIDTLDPLDKIIFEK